uniref:Acetyl-coenzyme A transporter 1 n=1 Tax=Heterosigma akashiwo TaxID=2829 RepID=A0A6V3DJ58_HETAK|mmetsp:Transcript_7445/g.10419  ORF Transcript_7445/g.10419 Transcript_7445/m.10419 type:complete len:537 (-) Transcript_7445:341-1951(-)
MARLRLRGLDKSTAPDSMAVRTVSDAENAKEKPVAIVTSWRDDLGSIILLLILYTLQGIPMGLSGSVPFLLQDKEVSYAEQALFSLVTLPFSLKLIWAPLVDSTYLPAVGRRKSWLVPVQLICGLVMLGATMVIDDWVGATGAIPSVPNLTWYFLFLYFLMATQDIAVDGWALTMLSEENVGYASTCNTIGQTIGYFVAHVGFLALQDAGVCNKYLRSVPSETGMVTLASFMNFWAIVFIVTTLYVWFFKAEKEEVGGEETDGLVETYKKAWQCIRLPAVKKLCIILMTCKIAFAATDAATSLKLVEYGMPKEELAMLSPFLVVLGVAIPVAIGRFTAGPRPLSVFVWGFPVRLVCGVVYAFVLPLAKPAYMVPGATPYSFYAALLLAVILHEVAANMMYVAQMAFFSKISDPAIGGTYMTLLNTIANLGTKWPNSASLYFMDSLTQKECIDDEGTELFDGITSVCMPASTECTEAGGSCVVVADGYYIQVALCTAAGLLWLLALGNATLALQELPPGRWRIGGHHAHHGSAAKSQ